MKSRRTIAMLIAVCLLMTLGFAGCSGGCAANPRLNSSGSSMYGSSNYGSSNYGSSNYGSSNYGSSNYGSSNYGSSNYSSSMPNASSNYGSSNYNSSMPNPSSNYGSSSMATMGTDFEEIGTLSSKSLSWGPGGPKDAKNRSQGALSYNTKYEKYNALFIGPDEPIVYMTFDEGYENGFTPGVLDILKEKQVKATFFVTRDFAKAEPDLVRRMIDEGHIIGNHSWTHRDYSTLTPKDAAEDMMQLHDYVKENYGYEMTYFRFPSGNFNEQTLAVAQSMGYKSLFWSFAYVDWLVDDQPEPAASADKIVKAACPGNIYLFHSVSSTNAQILGEVIDRIAAAGYTWGDPGTL